MTTSAHESASPWGADAWPAETDPQDGAPADYAGYDALRQEAPAVEWEVAYDEVDTDWEPTDQSIPDSSAEGLTGRALILSTALATGGCAAFDLMLTAGRMTFFFDLCFVVICLVATMAVRRDDLFTAGVLPPLMFAAVIAAVAVAAPHAFESAPGVSKVFLTGLANHAAGLVGGYAVALLAVAARMVASDNRGD